MKNFTETKIIVQLWNFHRFIEYTVAFQIFFHLSLREKMIRRFLDKVIESNKKHCAYEIRWTLVKFLKSPFRWFLYWQYVSGNLQVSVLVEWFTILHKIHLNSIAYHVIPWSYVFKWDKFESCLTLESPKRRAKLNNEVGFVDTRMIDTILKRLRRNVRNKYF